ncbi:MAG: Lrp/AsnC family transcriptional regulator, partial [Nitrososphaeria archaeon]|nr:Lrp/AsnC family transcriptional regulator [Nitrososphaeria archaeon]NIN51760.1 Lrp/AsnC family transcriptional regulator [Nitrososphaeria archaeon]NIQ32258.1 Lrp/AsnC family transcriptional regulator [Nitrososphaeria archaeon]
MKLVVHIVVDPRSLEDVCRHLTEVEEVKRVYEVTGEYDVFTEVEVNSVEDFRRLLKEKILRIAGV